MTSDMKITVIGGGLAGCEAAFQIAEKGLKVDLYEMRPMDKTEAHQTGNLAELVCSNSLRADSLENAAGLLKEELRRAGSLIMKMADDTKVPAGGALAVDREEFSSRITELIANHPLITLYREKIDEIPGEGYVVIATGPLTTGKIAEEIKKLLGEGYFHFFDAAAPVISGEGLDMTRLWWGSRYDKGTADYINCPLTEEEYNSLVDFLINAEKHKPHVEGEEKYFEGCMPVEEMARRGRQTLSFGPLKPVGLVNPHTGEEPYAVVQLRIDNRERSLFNLVGFQTSLTWGEQKKMLQLLPGLENVEIVRYGVMHQNSYIKSPIVLDNDGSLKEKDHIFFAGQITGVEGYIESTASGLVAGLSLANKALGKGKVVFPEDTAIGSLMHYITTAEPEDFQPMNITYGIMPPLEKKIRKKKEKRMMVSERALKSLQTFLEEMTEGR